MWELQSLTTLRASKACRGENFTFYFTYVEDISPYNTKKSEPRWPVIKAKHSGVCTVYRAG
jgi:hypothetical protein